MRRQLLPFSGISPQARHSSYTGAQTAAPRAGSQAWALLFYYRAHGPATDHDACQALALPLATICARRNFLLTHGLVGAHDVVPGPYGARNTRWVAR